VTNSPSHFFILALLREYSRLVYICVYNRAVKIEWDENKRRINLHKHGLDFRDAHAILAGVTLLKPDDRYEYGESRYISIGLLSNIVVAVVHTLYGEDVRIISMRKATRYEAELFFSNIGD
jgi:uncharacterized DUF497 family protein